MTNPRPPRDTLSRIMAAIVLVWLLAILTYVILKAGGTL